MTINSKNTKAEILAAYSELEKQNKTLESEIKKGIQNTSSVNQKVDSTPVNKSSATMSKNSHKNIPNTIQSLAQIQGDFGMAVSNLSEQLITEATQLEAVRKAIALEQLELENLHEITEIEESTIDTLLEQYQADVKKFTEEFSQQQEIDEQEIEELKQSWAKEQATHTRLIKTRDEDYRKSQERDKKEYQYNLELERDLDQEEYDQEQKLKQKELEENRQTLEKQWQEKETTIAKQEEQYAEAKEKVAAFEEKLQAKIKQGTEEGKGIGTHQAKVKADLRIREIEGEKQNYQLRIESLSQTISHQEARINKLSQQSDASLQQVQDLAVKAIEGTSNRNSFEAMKAIAMEQAKTQQKGK